MSILFQQLKGKSSKAAYITHFLGIYFTHSALRSGGWVKKNYFRLNGRRHCSTHLKLWLHSDTLSAGAENMGKGKGAPVETKRHRSGDVHIL